MICARGYLRCPPRVRSQGSFPSCAQRLTVFALTRNKAATSRGRRSSTEGWYRTPSIFRYRILSDINSQVPEDRGNQLGPLLVSSEDRYGGDGEQELAREKALKETFHQ